MGSDLPTRPAVKNPAGFFATLKHTLLADSNIEAESMYCKRAQLTYA